MYYTDNSQSIGNTPLVQIRRLTGDKAIVLGKVEGRNPSYSVKCRIGASMIWDAEDRSVFDILNSKTEYSMYDAICTNTSNVIHS